ncbi:hypothetical protein [Jeotgalibacillus soli]|uniref:hypothetical protein n=1 Tax=Jeotgalibacillus soli TaxID=889306 RepID=UPI00059797BB|nr:hypothetical protein [Jeotgalibacillus soli]
MGYIAPVNNNQYQLYAERVTMKRYDAYNLVPTHRITPQSRFHKELQNRLERESEVKESLNKSNFQQQSYSKEAAPSTMPQVSSHAITKFTGKGRHINEVI